MNRQSKANHSKRGTRVVATGKRVRGTWIMESLLAPKTRRSRGSQAMLAGENRRIRTLH